MTNEEESSDRMMILLDIFLKQPRRGHTLVTPHKRSAVWGWSYKRSAVWGRSHKRSAVWGLLLIFLLFCATSCNSPSKEPKAQTTPPDTTISEPESPKYSEFEEQLIDFGLVDIAEIDSTIGVELVYATPDNFLGHVLYPDLHHAFMIPAMAQKLVKAQQRLKSIHPELSLLIYDAARPLSIQREMWESVKGTPNISFVANPAKGRGMHNYGAAVDVTIMDSTGKPLPMGSKHDYFGPEARIDHEAELVANGLITNKELENRQLLRRVMTESGFITCVSEWWHFNHIPSIRAKEELKIIDFE